MSSALNHDSQFAPTCPLTLTEALDRYFIENRARLLDIAAFLDRLDRTQPSQSLNSKDTPSQDFRHEAFIKSVAILLDGRPDRAGRIHHQLSDETQEPLESAAKSQGAFGAPKMRSCC